MADSDSSSTSSENIQSSTSHSSNIWDHNFQESDFLTSIQVDSPFSSFDFEFEHSVNMSSEEESPSVTTTPVTTLLTWEESTKLSTSSIVCPKIGGLVKQDDGTLLAFSGTDPDKKVNVWSYDADKNTYVIEQDARNPNWTDQQGPSHVGQYRPRDIKQLLQIEKSCVTYTHTIKFLGLTSKDGSAPPISLSTWSQIIRTHLIHNGMWDVFQYEDPLTKTKVDLLKNMGRFQLEEVKKQIANVKLISDYYALQNLEWSGRYLLASIHSSLYEKVLNKIPVNSTGPEVLSAIIACSATYSYDAMENLKNKLKNIKISDFPGENVSKMNVVIKDICDRLYGSGFWEHDLLNSICKKYKAVSCEEFRLWTLSNLTSKVKVYLRMRGLQDPDTIDPSKCITYDQILDESTFQYEELFGQNEWTAAVKVKPGESTLSEVNLATISKAVIKHLSGKSDQSLQTKDGSAGANGGSNQDNASLLDKSKEQKCTHCDQDGCSYHTCPHKATRWYNIPPTGNTFSKLHYRAKDKKSLPCLWCTTCKSWRYTVLGGHLAKDHAAWKAKKDAASSTAADTPLASMASDAPTSARQVTFADTVSLAETDLHFDASDLDGFIWG